MLKLQCLRAGTWFDLLVLPEVKDEVRKTLNLSWNSEFNGHCEVNEFPMLSVWMKDNAYRDLYVKVLHLPDVNEASYSTKLTPFNLEKEMEELRKKIQQHSCIEEEDLPDYGSA